MCSLLGKGTNMVKTAEIKLVKGDKGEKIIHIKALDDSRLTHHGFGTFICDIKPSEIEITPDALEELLKQPERRGFQGLEFWPDNRMAWANPHPEFFVHPDDVNVPEGAKKWIRQMSITVEGDGHE